MQSGLIFQIKTVPLVHIHPYYWAMPGTNSK